MTINAAADGYFDLQFDFMGLPGVRSSEAIPAVDFSAFQDPLIVDNDNSPYVALGGVEIALRSFSSITLVDRVFTDAPPSTAIGRLLAEHQIRLELV